MRVTGAQGLSRAGLPEHTVALLARWGSSTVLLYIRKAPLTSTHLLARVVLLAGWERNQSAASSHRTMVPTVRPARGPTAVSASACNGFRPAARMSRLAAGRNNVGDGLQRLHSETLPQMKQRLASPEGHIEGLQRWRASFTAALPQAPDTPAVPPTGAVPERWRTVDAYFSFVSSIRSRTHKVTVGYPEPPRDWRTVRMAFRRI